MTDEERRLSRRLFLKHASVATAGSAAVAAVALKTDALAQQGANLQSVGPRGNNPPGMPYPYMNP